MMNSNYLVSAVFKEYQIEESRTNDVLCVLAASLLIALSAQVSLPLPFTPIPITGQSFAVLLSGAVLGPKRGALSVLAYLLEGAVGLPFFANGAFGMARLFGPSGGYLFGFVLAAWLSGWWAYRGADRNVNSAFVGFALAQVAIYAIGIPWLGFYLGFDGTLLTKAFYPFLPGLLIKSAAAGFILPSLWALLRH
jgi:biotin transport system substrate-specific component